MTEGIGKVGTCVKLGPHSSFGIRKKDLTQKWTYILPLLDQNSAFPACTRPHSQSHTESGIKVQILAVWECPSRKSTILVHGGGTYVYFLRVFFFECQ